MEHEEPKALWRSELRRLLDAWDRCRLHDLASGVEQAPDPGRQYAADPVLNWAWSGTLRYRIDGRWRRLAREDLGYARAGSWKRRAAQARLCLGKCIPRADALLLLRNLDGRFTDALHLPLADGGLAARYQAACLADERRGLRIRTATAELLLTAHDLLDAAAAPADPAAARFAAATAWLDEHLGEELDRRRVAAVVGCHPAHVSRLFRVHAGEAFTPWLRRRRLELARRLLVTTAMRVNAVAAASGFGSATYLIRCFRAAYGASPQRWRQAGVAVFRPAPRPRPRP